MDDATAGLITSEEARELIDAVNEQLGSEIDPILSRAQVTGI